MAEPFPPLPDFYGSKVGAQVGPPPELMQALQDWKQRFAKPPAPDAMSPIQMALQDWLDTQRGKLARLYTPPR